MLFRVPKVFRASSPDVGESGESYVLRDFERSRIAAIRDAIAEAPALATLFYVMAVALWTGLLSAASQLAAPIVARRIGLLNTMVFTHLPSNVLLALIPLMPSLELAVAMLLVRSTLSQMDVPTRSSYVMAIVPPDERAAAASVTSVPRSLASALSPALAGSLLGVSTFGWPLLVAGGVKIAYDLLLLGLFRTVRPPEEQSMRMHEPLVHTHRHVPDVQHRHRR